MLGIKLESCLRDTPLAENICIELEDVFRESLELDCGLTFIDFEVSLVDDLSKFLIDSVIFDSKIVFNELFKYFPECKLIDLTEGGKPSDLLPDLKE